MTAERAGAHGLRLRYRVAGDLDGVRRPPTAAPERTDGLWRHTCFEAFVRAEGAAYVEINLAPSGAWAAYRFDGYRAGMADAAVGPPRVNSRFDRDRFELEAELDLGAIPELTGRAPWRLALSAVVEDVAGGRSYWALRHPEGKPDFHHPDSFALELPPPEPS